jgi:hypothetical protein
MTEVYFRSVKETLSLIRSQYKAANDNFEKLNQVRIFLAIYSREQTKRLINNVLGS